MNLPHPDLEVIAADNNRCGEGPLWDAARNALFWTDAAVRKLFRYDGAGHSVLIPPANVGGLVLNADGRLVLSTREGLLLFGIDGRSIPLVSEFEGEALCLNDAIADPEGRVYSGTYHWGEAGMSKTGKLLLFSTDGKTEVVDDGIEMSNGLGFRADGRLLYFTDSAARIIYAYDRDPATGRVSNRRPWVKVPKTEGLPDGLTVDADGFVWSAQWFGSQVVRYDPDGDVERRIQMPVKQVSSVAFGGKELNELFITTAGEAWNFEALLPVGYDRSVSGVGGSLYRLRGEIKGRQEFSAKFCQPTP